MIDRGLLLTMALVVGLVAVLDRRLRRRAQPTETFLSLASTPLVAGLVAGRLVAVVLDDPASLRRPADLLLIRGGVEFWPGLAAAATAVWLAGRREPVNFLDRLADMAPVALWGYAAYEAACLLREGCFGPTWFLGVRPGGLGSRQVPVGVLVGLAAAALGIAGWRWSRRVRPAAVLAPSLAGLAAIRSAAGFALPKVSAGLTRPHRESMAALAVGLLLSAGVAARGRRGFRRVSRHAVLKPAAPGTAPVSDGEDSIPDESGPR